MRLNFLINYALHMTRAFLIISIDKKSKFLYKSYLFNNAFMFLNPELTLVMLRDLLKLPFLFRVYSHRSVSHEIAPMANRRQCPIRGDNCILKVLTLTSKCCFYIENEIRNKQNDFKIVHFECRLGFKVCILSISMQH